MSLWLKAYDVAALRIEPRADCRAQLAAPGFSGNIMGRDDMPPFGTIIRYAGHSSDKRLAKEVPR